MKKKKKKKKREKREKGKNYTTGGDIDWTTMVVRRFFEVHDGILIAVIPRNDVVSSSLYNDADKNTNYVRARIVSQKASNLDRRMEGGGSFLGDFLGREFES